MTRSNEFGVDSVDVIRLRLGLRILSSAGVLVLCGAAVALLTNVIPIDPGAPSPLSSALLMLLAAALFYRDGSRSVKFGGDELVMRGTYRTRRFRRADVAGFSIGAAGPGRRRFSQAIHMINNDGSSLALDVTATSPWSQRGTPRLESRLAALERWLAFGVEPLRGG